LLGELLGEAVGSSEPGGLGVGLGWTTLAPGLPTETRTSDAPETAGTTALNDSAVTAMSPSATFSRGARELPIVAERADARRAFRIDWISGWPATGRATGRHGPECW
jgi:hypothetical protein